MRCSLLLPMFAVSVRQSVSLSLSATRSAVCGAFVQPLPNYFGLLLKFWLRAMNHYKNTHHTHPQHYYKKYFSLGRPVPLEHKRLATWPHWFLLDKGSRRYDSRGYWLTEYYTAQHDRTGWRLMVWKLAGQTGDRTVSLSRRGCLMLVRDYEFIARSYARSDPWTTAVPLSCAARQGPPRSR